MTDPAIAAAIATAAARRTRAADTLAAFSKGDTFTALTMLLTQLRIDNTFGSLQYQAALDRSRTAWHRHLVIEDPSKAGTDRPRAQVWRRALNRYRIVGDYWWYWPRELKNRIVADCVRTESEAMAEHLAPYGAAWDPKKGRITGGGMNTILDVQSGPMRAAAYTAVLDQYASLEARALSTFCADKADLLEQRGYSCEFKSMGLAFTNWVSVDIRGAVTVHTDDPDGPITVEQARAWKQFAEIADGLPPRRVDREDRSWYRPDYIEQMHTIDDPRLADPAVAREFMAALADARTAAINRALDDAGTDHLWDPRIDLALPRPDERPPPLDPAVGTPLIEAAKASVDPAVVWAAITAPNPYSVIPYAFPAAAPAPVDTSENPDATADPSAPAPELRREPHA